MPRDPKALLKSAIAAAGMPMTQNVSGSLLAAQMGSALAGLYRGRELPEDPRLFSDPGLFGPLTPAEVYPIDSATPGMAGGPPPRVWQYPVGWNMPTGPRAYEAISFTALEAISDRVDAVRKAIELIKDEVSSADYEIVLVEHGGLSRRNGALRRVEHYPDAVVLRPNRGGNRYVLMADFCLNAHLSAQTFNRNPIELRSMRCCRCCCLYSSLVIFASVGSVSPVST